MLACVLTSLELKNYEAGFLKYPQKDAIKIERWSVWGVGEAAARQGAAGTAIQMHCLACTDSLTWNLFYTILPLDHLKYKQYTII